MKILLVAMSDSIHTARWVGQIAKNGWDVRIFPSIDHGGIHPALRHVPAYNNLFGYRVSADRKLKRQRYRLFAAARSLLGTLLLPILWPLRRLEQLRGVIDEFQPDIIHSLEFQAAGYLTAAAKRTHAGAFPAWIATNWGSDIYYFRQFPEHEKKIREVLELCDFYSCECRRDICLAEGLGLKGKALPVIPNTGGFDLEVAARLRQPGPVASRRKIVLKGYQHWVGRALVGLAALEQCKDLLDGYNVVIHSASPETSEAAAAFYERTGIQITLLPHGTPHEQLLEHYGQARVALGLSLSDGVSTSFLEGLVMGAFPVQSWTACADEWIKDGTSGLLVPPEDVAVVSAALRQALSDDDLVNYAADENWKTAQERLDQRRIRLQASDFYRTVAREREIPCS